MNGSMKMDKKIKVLHILNTGGYSGAENVVINMIKGMKQWVDAVYVSPRGIIEGVLVKEQIKYIPVDKINIKNMKKIFDENTPDIIHAHDFTTGVIVSLCAPKIAIINHLHNNTPWIKKYGINSILYFIISKRFKKILTVSDSIEKEYVFGDNIKQKIEVVGNPIDIKSIIAKSRQKTVSECYDIAFVGRITQQKNPFFFVNLIKEIKKEIDEVSVVMVGDGPEKENVARYIAENRLSYNIDMVGFQNNPYAFILNSKVVCMPSLWEGFGLAAVEGLALGKPVVCSGVGGLKDIVDDDCGMICNNLDSYVVSIKELLLDNNIYKKKSDAAIERAKELDNLDSYCASILKIYDSIINI